MNSERGSRSPSSIRNRPSDRKLLVQIVGDDPRGILRIDRDGMGFVKSGLEELSHHLVLISPTHEGFYMGRVLIYHIWIRFEYRLICKMEGE